MLLCAKFLSCLREGSGSLPRFLHTSLKIYLEFCVACFYACKIRL